MTKTTNLADVRRPGKGPWVGALAIACVLAYVGFIEYAWGWPAVLAAWREVGFGMASTAFLLLVSTHLVRNYRLYDYFRETRGRFLDLFRLAQVHNILNIMLPLRSGEASFPILMRSEFSVPLLKGTSALLVMRLLDLHALFAAAGCGLALQDGGIVQWSLWLLFLLAPLLAFQTKRPLTGLAERLLPDRLMRRVAEVEAGLPSGGSALLRAWAMTVLNWGVKVAVLAWVLGLMGVTPFAAWFGGALGGELSSVLPVHAPGGVGTYPAGIVAGALALGAPARGEAMDMLARAAVNLHLLIVVSALAGLGLSLVLSFIARRLPGRR